MCIRDRDSAELMQKWVGLCEVDRHLGNGMYSPRACPPVKVHAIKLKIVKQALQHDYMRSSTQIEDNKFSGDSLDIEKPQYDLLPRR